MSALIEIYFSFFREDDFYANMAAMSDDDVESDISEADVNLVAKSLDVSCFFLLGSSVKNVLFFYLNHSAPIKHVLSFCATGPLNLHQPFPSCRNEFG